MTTTVKYRPTGPDTPNPTLLVSLYGYIGRWVTVTEALPPERAKVIVQVRGDDTPAFAWLRFSGGDKTCPFFVCPQSAAIRPRGLIRDTSAPCFDVTHWFSPSKGYLPWSPPDYRQSKWGLCSNGWSGLDDPLPIATGMC